MDVNPKDERQVLLVQEKDNDRMNVVTGLDKSGIPKTVLPKQKNEPEFMKLDKAGNILENFMTNYFHQAKDPTHFVFFKVAAGNIETNVQVLSQMSKSGEDGKRFLDNYRVDTSQFKATKEQEDVFQEQKPTSESIKQREYKPIDENRINWSQLERLGINRETLVKTNALNDMLNWRKSSLLTISPKFDDIILHTQARLAFRETVDGQLKVVIHAIQRQPELDRPYYGTIFSKEDKVNLQSTGNLGRIAELKLPDQENPIRAFISIDKLTNELVAFRADKIAIPDDIKGVKLSEEQKKDLAQGRSIYLEGMTAKTGKIFNATVQINADKRGVEFQFGNTLKQNQLDTDNQATQQTKNKEIRIPKRLGDVELASKEQETLRQGGVVYVSGLIDKKGQPYNAYVQVNNERGKLDFFRRNPQKKQEIIPDNNARIQVAVNSEGKTNEATKQTPQPLKSGQSELSQNQKSEIEQKQKPQKKSKGIKQ